MPIRPELTAVYGRHPRIVGRKIADEFVLVPIVGRGAELDAIYNLNKVGAFIWEHLDGRATGQAIVEALVERYDVTPADAERDFVTFIEQLLSVNAVAAVPSDTA